MGSDGADWEVRKKRQGGKSSGKPRASQSRSTHPSRVTPRRLPLRPLPRATGDPASQAPLSPVAAQTRASASAIAGKPRSAGVPLSARVAGRGISGRPMGGVLAEGPCLQSRPDGAGAAGQSDEVAGRPGSVFRQGLEPLVFKGLFLAADPPSLRARSFSHRSCRSRWSWTRRTRHRTHTSRRSRAQAARRPLTLPEPSTVPTRRSVLTGFNQTLSSYTYTKTQRFAASK